jgi:hypothetical protein
LKISVRRAGLSASAGGAQAPLSGASREYAHVWIFFHRVEEVLISFASIFAGVPVSIY